MTLHITELNWECLLHLFSFLDKDSRKNLSQTCRKLRQVFLDPSLWPLLNFHSPAELKKNNYLLGPSLKFLSICWHSSRVKVCNIEDWMKSTFQRDLCSKHENTVSEFLMRVCNMCPNLLSLMLSGCGHVKDHHILQILQCCPGLQTLHLENCSRITDLTLVAITENCKNLNTLQIDFCRNVSHEGLKLVKEKMPSLILHAERSAEMIPDSKPDEKVQLARLWQKALHY
ncbi:F-box and leucine-rich protein 22 [Protopterus annectens]|uniref:F-box and leucine-rich protein 22 n=1 Tax=Protopterus annectens TaxID=7888 RepID=UPI001CFBCACA|nr:F-box and leucine-rich protein 22 [Protopterus annectens]